MFVQIAENCIYWFTLSYLRKTGRQYSKLFMYDTLKYNLKTPSIETIFDLDIHYTVCCIAIYLYTCTCS